MSEQIEKTQTGPKAIWQELSVDLVSCLRFYSRLPVPALPWEQSPHALPDFPRLARVLPLAGVVLGLLPALVLGIALLLDLGPWLAAILSVATMTFTTGAFHEDGLADTADSFGGATKQRRLEIMRDSRIGSFGAAALMLTLALRIAALATLASRIEWSGVLAALLIAASLSRTAGLMLLVFLPPARTDGASYAVGRPTPETFWFASVLAGGIAVILGLLGQFPPTGIFLMLALSGLTGLAFMRLAQRHIGGQTGDMAGAAQQVAEIAALVGLLTMLEA
ncbi:adenosylcobinamide-GDP ribazoletransferase [Microvirga roseola]|uniref:adenosylcobinamide-GDP ribazoletransferase n=1 Tax=Microvirga roseola TaxID=2883126 RepID=UPI001E2C8D75|nr:adenosylcobinamide-GDP ribazoletransferase [Microvirga roseola]